MGAIKLRRLITHSPVLGIEVRCQVTVGVGPRLRVPVAVLVHPPFPSCTFSTPERGAADLRASRPEPRMPAEAPCRGER